MPGRLYRIRWYPGMRAARSADDLVSGELYRLRQSGNTLKILDDWEEQYDRELHRATLESGLQFKAWVYIYKKARPEHCFVVSGEWQSNAN
jgi:gamma-glutamylcyclotransferase (GGCT)/AIG2-like uncharacterized protein YtfP